MLCIVINHLFMAPSLWMVFTGKTALWVSAAEGFFFLSGLMVGLVRGKDGRNGQSLKPSSKKLLHRAWLLYLTNIIVVTVSVILARDTMLMSPSSGVKGGFPASGALGEVILRAATFQLNYGWADFLQFYIVFLLLAIPVLWVMKKRMWYLVLGLAVLGWFEPNIIELGSISKYYFYWQFYFFLGLIIGYHYFQIRAWFESRSIRVQHNAKKVVVWIFITSWVANWIMVYSPKVIKWPSFPEVLKPVVGWIASVHKASEGLFYVDRTGILRPLVFMIWILGMYFLFVKFEASIRSRLDWLLGELGRQSLRVYVVSSLIALYFPALIVPGSFIYNTLIVLMVVVLILIIIRQEFVKRIIPN